MATSYERYRRDIASQYAKYRAKRPGTTIRIFSRPAAGRRGRTYTLGQIETIIKDYGYPEFWRIFYREGYTFARQRVKPEVVRNTTVAGRRVRLAIIPNGAGGSMGRDVNLVLVIKRRFQPRPTYIRSQNGRRTFLGGLRGIGKGDGPKTFAGMVDFNTAENAFAAGERITGALVKPTHKETWKPDKETWVKLLTITLPS